MVRVNFILRLRVGLKYREYRTNFRENLEKSESRGRKKNCDARDKNLSLVIVLFEATICVGSHEVPTVLFNIGQNWIDI